MSRRTLPPPHPAPPESADEIESQFYEGLRHADLERVMAAWSDDDDISCVHPGGPRLVGAVAIRASFEVMLGHGAVDIRPEKVRRLQSHACAVHSVLERVQVLGADGVQSAWVIATNVYVHGAQGWRLVAHHASPATAAAVQDLVEAVSVLH
jgi:ketosteroid isomerase-like protein